MGRMKIPDAASAPTRRPHLAPPFPKGVSGNPKGRIMGSRNKLTEKFIDDLSAFYEIEGASLIKRVADEQPAMLLQVVARLMPKDISLNISGGVEVELTVDQRTRIAESWLMSQSDRMSTIEGEAVRVAALPEALPDGEGDDEPDDLDAPPEREPEPVAKRASNAGVHRQAKRAVHSRLISSGAKHDD